MTANTANTLNATETQSSVETRKTKQNKLSDTKRVKQTTETNQMQTQQQPAKTNRKATSKIATAKVGKESTESSIQRINDAVIQLSKLQTSGVTSLRTLGATISDLYFSGAYQADKIWRTSQAIGKAELKMADLDYGIIQWLQLHNFSEIAGYDLIANGALMRIQKFCALCDALEAHNDATNSKLPLPTSIASVHYLVGVNWNRLPLEITVNNQNIQNADTLPKGEGAFALEQPHAIAMWQYVLENYAKQNELSQLVVPGVKKISELAKRFEREANAEAIQAESEAKAKQLQQQTKQEAKVLPFPQAPSLKVVPDAPKVKLEIVDDFEDLAADEVPTVKAHKQEQVQERLTEKAQEFKQADQEVAEILEDAVEATVKPSIYELLKAPAMDHNLGGFDDIEHLAGWLNGTQLLNKQNLLERRLNELAADPAGVSIADILIAYGNEVKKIAAANG